jgi:hypothetical protein
MSSYQRYPNEREIRPYGDEEADFSSESNREFDRESSTSRSGRYRGRDRRTQEGRGGWERESRGTLGDYGRDSWEREGRERNLDRRARGWEGYGGREREGSERYEGWRDLERYGRESGRRSRGFAGGYGAQSEYESPSYRAYSGEGEYGRGYEGEREWNRFGGTSASDMRGFEGTYGRQGWNQYDEQYSPRGYESGLTRWSERREQQFGWPRYESAGFGAGPEGVYGMHRGYERGDEYSGRGRGSSWSGKGYSGQGSSWGGQEYTGQSRTGSAWGTPSYAGVGPRGYQRSDERVREDVCDRLERDARIDASNIEVEVRNGMVTLKGSVDDRMFKREAEEAIENLPGVKDVQNQIRVEKRFGQTSESKESRPGDGGTTGREGKDRKSTTTL